MELCLELCRMSDISTENISSQDIMEKNIPKILLFISRLAIFYSGKGKKKPKKAPSKIGMTKKSKSKGTIEPVIDTDEVEITLTQNILDQINSFSQKKQLRQTVSPSGTNIPLDVLLSNGNTETTTSNNSQNNELRDSQNGKNEEGQKKGPPPPVPKRNTTDTEIKSNPKNFFSSSSSYNGGHRGRS